MSVATWTRYGQQSFDMRYWAVFWANTCATWSCTLQAVIFAPVSSIYEIVGVVQSRYISAQILKNRPKSDIYVKGAYVWTRTQSEYSSSLVYATRLQTFQYNMIFWEI